MRVFEVQQSYQSYDISGHGGQLSGDIVGGLYYTSSFRICREGREVFTLSCCITPLVVEAHGKSNNDVPDVLCQEGLKYIHSLIDSQNFEEGEEYRYWVTFDKGSERWRTTMNTRNPHQALKTEVIAQSSSQNVRFLVVRLQWSKNDIAFSLHAEPRGFSVGGIQVTDFLNMLGSQRGTCPFLGGRECYVRWIHEGFKLEDFVTVFSHSFDNLLQSQQDLERCGYFFDQPEGWGYFFGKSSSGRRFQSDNQIYGDGHTAAISKFMKRSEDDSFYFIFTWLKSDERNKGWVIHYRPKHPPASSEIQSVFRFLGIKDFEQCPQYEFEPCHWWSIAFVSGQDEFFDSNAEVAHSYFDAHATHFSSGIQKLLNANADMERFGMGFLPFRDPEIRLAEDIKKRITSPDVGMAETDKAFDFDVALSFAGTERQHADALASVVKGAGFSVFYDNYYPEELWGKDLVVFFDEIYRKRSRYCVMFVSEEYNNRIWTIHERRSAQARALEEKGREYILPIKVDDTELPGMPPTIGHLSINEGIDKIADVLIKKLQKSS